MTASSCPRSAATSRPASGPWSPSSGPSPGHEQPLAAAIATLTAAVRREPGCLEFRSFKDAANPGVFYLYERYADTSAFRAHLTTDHVAHFFTELARHSTADAQALVQLIELPAP